MGCHCVLVSDGAEAISVALGDISEPFVFGHVIHPIYMQLPVSEFDLILMDLNMPNGASYG